MLNWYKKTRPRDERDSLDALLALQMLEDQEQSQEQEFYRITNQGQFGRHGGELETELPKLLKTKRERALYDAFMLLIKTQRDSEKKSLKWEARSA
jgi:hypothetical protein